MRLDRSQDVEILTAPTANGLDSALATAFAAGKLPIGPIWASVDDDEFSIPVAVPSVREKKQAFTKVGIVSGADTTALRSALTTFATTNPVKLLFAARHNTRTYLVVGVPVA